MKFALNNYNINFAVEDGEEPPVAGAQLVRLPFGVPPFEKRETWLVEVEDLDALLKLIGCGRQILDISFSGFWEVGDDDKPARRFYGIALMDDPDFAGDMSESGSHE
ncbi:MAG TPA: hypothetical protein VHL34_09440 [Rhizomicrobium sp.]|jgi:hypothetical protein|nr:hypothetical protein [Rhizomicrobium sp.]